MNYDDLVVELTNRELSTEGSILVLRERLVRFEQASRNKIEFRDPLEQFQFTGRPESHQIRYRENDYRFPVDDLKHTIKTASRCSHPEFDLDLDTNYRGCSTAIRPNRPNVTFKPFSDPTFYENTPHQNYVRHILAVIQHPLVLPLLTT